MRTTHWICGSIIASTAACTGLIDGGGPPQPTLLALSTQEISMGQPIDFYGGGFLNDVADSHTEIRFQGQFVSDQGHTYSVDYKFEPLWNDGNHVVWPF